MSYFKTKESKMHQIRFRLGRTADPAGGAHSAPPDILADLAGFKGPTSKRREGKERKRKRKGKRERGKEEGKCKVASYGCWGSSGRPGWGYCVV